MQLCRLVARFASMAALAAVPMLAFGQDGDDIDEDAIEEIVVTGTGVARTQFETPQTVTQFSEDDVRLFTSNSQADILTQLPGISAEGGGGEVATNVFARGLPSGGQFSFTPLLFDGIPAFTTFGLNSSAFDVFYRPDLGIERVEYVTGGSTNLFGPGSVAGIVNYISKTGGPNNEGTLQVEAAEEGRFRGDYFFSGPLGDVDSNTFYAVSGFYRYDEGPVESGLKTQGFQLRGNLKREFEDGSGFVALYGQAIDDSVQFFLPLPLDGIKKERLRGNDGKEVFTMNTVEATGLSYATPDGVFRTPIGDGVVTKGNSIAAIFEKDLNADWTLNAKIKYARYDHQFNLFLDGDGLAVDENGDSTGALPETLSEYLERREIDAFAANAVFTFADDGSPLPADFLVFGNRTLDRFRDATDFSTEISVGRDFSVGNSEHAVTIGGFFSNSQADDINYITTYLGDFRNVSRMVNVRLVGVQEDADGNLIDTGDPSVGLDWTLNGLAKANGMVGNRDRSARRTAFYIADQIEMDRWTFDIGARVERLDGDVLQLNTDDFRMGSDPSIADNLEVVSFIDGSILQDTVDTTEWAISASTLYRLNDSINLFGNISRGYFFPQIRSVPFSDGKLASYEGEIIFMVEAGLKLQTDNFDGYATLYYTELDNRRNVDFVNDPNNPGSVIEEVTEQGTESFGLEAGGTYAFNDYWSLTGNITIREHEFTSADDNPDIIGNELRRQPNEFINLAVRYAQGGFDAALMYNFHGDNFADDGNNVELDSYNLLRLDAGYTFELDNDQRIRVSAHVFNLTDEQGITEGSPRQGNAQSGEPEQFFIGRPILPRRAMLRVTYDF